MGGALLAHTIAGLLDGRRSLTHPLTSFAPLSLDAGGTLVLRPFYRTVVSGKRVLLADDVRNTGKTFERAKSLIESAGGIVLATVQIYDRMEAIVDLGIPNIALAEYRAPENYRVADCPMCKAGTAITRF
jgi:hypoxanthine phosphoribosyltransferase